MALLLLLAAGALLGSPTDGLPHRVVKRQAVSGEEQLWPKGMVKYRFDFAFTARERKNIAAAMKEWESFTCVKFVEVASGTREHHAKIRRNDGGCYSTTGYEPSDDQTINLGTDCMDQDIVAHELGHTLGLLHEQERTIRDRFVDVNPKRIQSQYVDQFEKPDDQKDFGLPYSYRSIMHYGKDFFNKKGMISILAKDKKFTDIIGNAKHLSFKDAWIVNKMYKCAAHCKTSAPCPPGSFRGKDCRCWCSSVSLTAVDCGTGKAIDSSRAKPLGGRVMKNPSGSVFFWSEHEVNWFDARDNCRNMGGSLVDVDSPSTLPEIENNIYTLVTQGYDPEGRYLSNFLWTGGNDLEREGAFQWLNGKRITISQLKMARGEPNNGGGLNDDCLAIFPQDLSEFADWDCGKNMRYICSFPDANCHDVSPSCPYLKRIGQCSDPRFKSKCRYTCGKCTISKTKSTKTTTETSIPNNVMVWTPTFTVMSSQESGDLSTEDGQPFR